MDAKLSDFRNPKDQYLFQSLESYYQKHPEHWSVVISIVRHSQAQKPPVSLRLLNHFVVNYAQEKNVVYYAHDRLLGGQHLFGVATEYKGQLKCFSKKLFDPFCRGPRIHFRGVRTTLKQLNFFRWALQNNVYTYVLRNVSTIEKHMRDTAVEPPLKPAPRPASLMHMHPTTISFGRLNT